MPEIQLADEEKQLASLLFLKTNLEANEQVRRYFGRQLKRGEEIDCGVLTFNISSHVYFQPVSNFRKQIASDSLFSDWRSIGDPLVDKEMNGFDSYQSNFLTKIIPRSSSRLYLAFSKPVGDYLIAEFYLQGSSSEEKLLPLNENFKRGTFVHLLFYFNEDNTVKNMYVSGFHYN